MDIDPEEAETTALIHGIAQGGIETVGTWLEIVTLGLAKPFIRMFGTCM